MHVNHKCIKIRTVYCLITVTLIFALLYLYNTSYLKKTEVEIPRVTTIRPPNETTETFKNVAPKTTTKYILLWTDPSLHPFVYFGEGNSIFTKGKCGYTNCYVTSNKELLRDLTEYDIVAFNGPQLDIGDLPRVRSFHQKYVYANIEAADNYPICTDDWNHFFNWTWTYKLNSDAIWGYIVVTNSSNHIVGPSLEVDWMSLDDMAPIDMDLKQKLATKSKAAAWFVSNCNTISEREEYVNVLQTYLGDFNLKIDVYGACGTFQCPKEIMNKCLDEVEKKYYFFLAFENAISEDYVTEKVLLALNHYAVPIVYGGADYSRFLPPGSYLNAKQLGPYNLAKEMFDIIENREIYYRFFRWRKYYSFGRRFENPDSNEYCKFCAMANDENLMKETKIYHNFSSWWNAKICNFGNNSTSMRK
ncbi:alpha-(1,3)-fucosyltransferase C-like [Spodoptera frugiperda]|uniref:Fucosyltransferase n=1 Tax=Spodoptera frugiperda TaxID=7108 RepID=A0A9R0EI55_SPOFR|nr:alpha-(1,3)-fucosyltransferase C-like [Spodoptera frugiperda]